MLNSQDLTLTEGRTRQAVNDTIANAVMPKVKSHVKKTVENERPKTGIVTKFYQYLDKAEVRLDGTNEIVLCTILHRFSGELIDFYTPNGDNIYCEKLGEPCIKPRDDLHCMVMNTNTKNSEWLLLGYFHPNDIVGVAPAQMGNFKIVTVGGTNQYWIKFGYDGLDIRSSSEMTTNVGELDAEMTPITYAESDTVYTKEEVDELIEGGSGSPGVGSFSINDQGHLIVTIPDGMANPYSINNEGHLIYDTSATNGGE